MERTIGIKVADGTFYPVLEGGFRGEKRLVLTTARDNQAEVHIDLYQGSREAGIPGSRFIGSLIIENVRPVPKGKPDIEVVIGASGEGTLNVSATDKGTGEEQSLSVSLRAEGEAGYELPDFAVEEPGSTSDALARRQPSEAERQESARTALERGGFERPRRRLAVAIVLAVLGLALVGVVAYLLYKTLWTPSENPVVTAGAPAVEAPRAAVEAPKVAEPAKAAPVASGAVATPATKPAAANAGTLTGGERGVRYGVKWGDTLWDLSSSYYRDPWLYPRIARANGIADPDLIFAGTTIFIPER